MMPTDSMSNAPDAQVKTTDRQWVSQALAYCVGKIYRNAAVLEDFPEMTRGERWATVGDGGWVGGHWVGLLWLANAYTGDWEMERQARRWAARLQPRQFDLGTHDLGFLFELSHILGGNITGDAGLYKPALQAARSLTQRFNAAGKFFQAWGPLNAPAVMRGRVIIDTMMNLDMMYWASRVSGEPQFAEMATEHACTSLARQVRPDFSTSHGADFDPETGKFIEQKTHQGLSADSCWSRGHAWAVYGCADCFRATQGKFFIDTARSLADYALARLPEDKTPFWDYSSPLIPHDVRDSSAGSILSSGLLNLAVVEPDPVQAARWKGAAEEILHALWENYTSRESIEPSILIHATRSKPEGHYDHGLIYGDYYFMEGLLRLNYPELAKAILL